MDPDVFEYANFSNLSYIEELYSSYLKDSASVDESWRLFFDGMAFAEAMQKAPTTVAASPELKIYHLIHAYRIFGHRLAAFDPISLEPPKEIEDLKLEKLGFNESDLNKSFPTCGFLQKQQAPLSEILDALKKTYCNKVGIEYMGMQSPELERWLQERIEPYFEVPLTADEKKQILHHLNKSEILESFIHMKYPGQKRFSVEGGETIIPVLAEVIDQGAKEGVIECVLGMAHRGRLNILTNILGKSYAQIFSEFESGYIPESFEGSGDVNYHKGFSADITTNSGKQLHVALAANPSHLESVAPVVEGKTRAKQELKCAKEERSKIMPIVIHGEAALSGQGVVYETMQLAQLTGYSTGGTIHLVINNKVGFTAGPKEAMSTLYCTDIARTFGAPVFHVNAEEPESCVYAARLAVEIRQKFKCDVFIELNCYRKYGHNETDEPRFTQPLIYKIINQKDIIRNIYRDRLVQEGTLSTADAETLENEFKQNLDRALEETQKAAKEGTSLSQGSLQNGEFKNIETAVEQSKLLELAQKFCSIPEGFHINPKVKRLLEERLKMAQGEQNVDWGMAEHFAYATLVTEGIHVRISGQDSRRGTFSHRHCAIVDQENETRYFPLSHLSETQAKFDVYNSCLSEYAVMAFEYGYSLSNAKALVIWEGQFGDFANGSQIMIDQYLSSGEQKWNRFSSLTLFLPHGYEGQGAEHSSARIERYLQLAGDDNMFIIHPTTPAQLFHLLRRHAHQEMKKPLIVFTPKGLLRFPPSLSPLEDFTKKAFEEILDDPQEIQKPKRLIFCSGKVYYNLIEEREKRNVKDFVFIRIEQLYPLRSDRIKELIEKYNGFKECYWVQEEHINMGAWEFIQPHINALLPENSKLQYVGRKRSAAAAAGTSALHKKELQELLDKIFA